MELPSDPMMLYSTVNMYLRDRYASLDELCADLDVDRAQLEEKLRAVGFEYSAEHNKFWKNKRRGLSHDSFLRFIYQSRLSRNE